MVTRPTPEEQLRRVELVTEATLAHLSLERLSDELLVRVRELLNVDTAAILLLDDSRRSLVATAAKGLEEEVERGVRIPVGGGFAGKVAATAKPVILPRVDHGEVLNPILLEKGIRSLLGVPLIANGQVVGVLHVGTLTPRDFTDDDVSLLQLVADRVALAIQARTQERQRMLAETLQRSLLPDAIPVIEGVDLAVRYVPAEGGLVGGDWFDIFELPSGRLCLSVGDVVGRGLAAAIGMARLRNAVRALAFVDQDPVKVVTHANDLIFHFESGIMATMLFGLLSEGGVFSFASAGHLPPLVIDASGKATLLDESGEPALGAIASADYHERIIELEPGSTLVLYTDGLVESRDRSLDEGFDDLMRSAEQQSWTTAEELCLQLAGPDIVEERREDDLALVALRFLGAEVSEELEVTIKARPRELGVLRRWMRRWLDQKDLNKQDFQDVLVAVGEAVANSIEHAYPPGTGTIEVSAAVRDGVLEIVVADFGQWRESRGQNRGRGRMLMRELMDEVTFDTTDSGTRVTLRKKIDNASR